MGQKIIDMRGTSFQRKRLIMYINVYVLYTLLIYNKITLYLFETHFNVIKVIHIPYVYNITHTKICSSFVRTQSKYHGAK